MLSWINDYSVRLKAVFLFPLFSHFLSFHLFLHSFFFPRKYHKTSNTLPHLSLWDLTISCEKNPLSLRWGDLSLSHQHVNQPPALQGQPACKYTLFQLASAQYTQHDRCSTTALPCQGDACPLAWHGGTPVEHWDPALGKATCPTSVLVHMSLGWGKH